MKIISRDIIKCIAAPTIAIFALSAIAEKPEVYSENGHVISHRNSDPYRWMENGDDYRLEPWIRDQNKKTNRYLAGDLKNEILNELSTEVRSLSVAREDKNFRLRQYIDQVQKLEREDDRLPFSANSPILQPFVSPDGQYQVSLVSNNGGDLRTARIQDLVTGEYLPDTFQVKFANFNWNSSGDKLIYSTDKDSRIGGTLPALYAHTVGEETNLNDKLIWEASTPFQYPGVATIGEDITYLSINDAQTDETSWYYFDLDTLTIGEKFWSYKGGISGVMDGTDFLYISNSNASNGELYHMDFNTMKEERLVAEQDLPMHRLSIWNDQLFIHFLNENVTHEISKYDAETKELNPVSLPVPGIYGFYPSDFGSMGYAISYAFPYINLDYNDEKLAFELNEEAQAIIDSSDIEAQAIPYELASGHTSVIWVMTKKGVEISKKTPLYLYGYGGFNINLLPNYYRLPNFMPFLNRGGAYAVVTLPGGMEKGEDWHQLGNLRNKKNVFKAMAKAARTLQKQGISSRHHMAIGGGSNGGLLVGATINRYPHLFRAAIPEVGVMDMLRYHKHTGGKWWESEYGNPDSRQYRRYLRSYSPYHNIGYQDYPSILVMTSDGDDRVVPAHSYKYTARLQDKLRYDGHKTKSVVLLNTEKFGSHGGSQDEEEALNATANRLTFLLKELR